VCPVEFLKVQKLERPFSFASMPFINGIEEIQITLRERFVNDDMAAFLGSALLSRMINRPFFYMVIKLSEEQLETLYHLIISVFFSHVQVCLDSLWFVKDNSCHSLQCYYAVHENKFFGISNNYRVSTTCIGKYEEMQFTSDELENAFKIDQKISEILNINMDAHTIEKMMDSGFRDGMENNRNYNDNNRIARAYFFLKSARDSEFILLKISLYVSMYECLFTTDASEIIHKMAERIACYYSKNADERLDIFKFIKKVYNVRSRYFHGKDLDKDKTFEKVPEMLLRLDGITRTILKRIILEDSEIFLKNETDLENYFTTLILS
jgi:hypothetical protein